MSVTSLLGKGKVAITSWYNDSNYITGLSIFSEYNNINAQDNIMLGTLLPQNKTSYSSMSYHTALISTSSSHASAGLLIAHAGVSDSFDMAQSVMITSRRNLNSDFTTSKDFAIKIDGTGISLMYGADYDMEALGGKRLDVTVTGGDLHGTWTSDNDLSDERVKNSIEILDDRYELFFDSLISYRYKYNFGTSGRYHTGYIA